MNNTIASAFEKNDTKPFLKSIKAQMEDAAGIALSQRDSQPFF